MKIRIKYNAEGWTKHNQNLTYLLSERIEVSGYVTFDYDEQKWKALSESDRVDICNEHLEKVFQWSYDDDINEE
jgi:hypothetical protein